MIYTESPLFFNALKKNIVLSRPPASEYDEEFMVYNYNGILFGVHDADEFSESDNSDTFNMIMGNIENITCAEDDKMLQTIIGTRSFILENYPNIFPHDVIFVVNTDSLIECDILVSGILIGTLVLSFPCHFTEDEIQNYMREKIDTLDRRADGKPFIRIQYIKTKSNKHYRILQTIPHSVDTLSPTIKV